VIFVTVGTHHQPFTRLIRALECFPPEELSVQHGYSPPPTRAAEACAFMGYDDVLERIGRARVVVTHAGVGTVLSAIRLGHVPVVVPRRAAFDEHVDDHQVDLTSAMAAAGKVLPVWHIDELEDIVASAPPPGAPEPTSATRLNAAVRHALLD
jgi:UDP-N-acetylglucosamine transferase subunit ALG13